MGWLDACTQCDGGESRNACPDCHGQGYLEVEHPEWDAEGHPELDEEISEVMRLPTHRQILRRRFRLRRPPRRLPGPEDVL